MNIFDMIKETAGAQVNEYAGVLGELSQDAIRWSIVGASGLRCGVRRRTNMGLQTCMDAAIGGCLACQAPVCLGHSMVSPGKILCFACVQAAKAHVDTMRGAGRVPPPYEGPPKREPGKPFGFVPDDEKESQRKQHLDRFGLEHDASWKSIQAKYKKLAFDCHPDRAKGKRAQDKAAQRLQELNEAMSWLRAHYEKRAA